MNNTELNPIEKITIKGLWDKWNIDWELHPKVNILIGKNGMGKSTILRVIKEKLVTYFLDYNNIELKKNKMYLSSNLLLKKASPKVNFSILYVNTFDAFLPINEIKKNKDSSLKTELDYDLWKAIFNFKNFVYILSQKEKDATTTLEAEIKLLTQNTNGDTSNYSKIGQLYTEIEAIRTAIYAPRDRLIAAINEYLGDSGKQLDFDKNYDPIFQPNALSPYQLSAGEKQLLVIFFSVVVTLGNNNSLILLMDEPEISLHLGWQEKLIATINHLHPNCQQIIVTHSPSIFGKAKNYQITHIEDIITPYKK